jgi:hypothetical protein
MGTIRIRFILVALAVGFFAIGMAAFLDYFKYKSTFGETVRSRVLVTGRNIENSVQASLSVGLQFSELGTLTDLMKRELESDTLTTGFDVFDHTGQVIYSTDPARVKREVPASWLKIAEVSKSTEWNTEEGEELVAGITLKNNFDLTVGYLALRYSADYVDKATAKVGREIAMASGLAFLAVVLIAPFVLIIVIRRFERDLLVLESAVSHLEDGGGAPIPTDSPFGTAIESLRDSLAQANKGLDEVRAKLDAAGT